VVFGLGIVNFLILPNIAGMHARGDRIGLQHLVTKAARIVSLMAAAGLAILLFAGHPLLSLMFGAEFTEAYMALIILAFGQLVNALFGPVALVLNMTGHERLTLIGVLVAVGVNVLLNLLLIPRFGMEGAACASAAALITWNVVLAIILRRRVGYCSSVVPCRQAGV
jgi:O-antigen/teichoic acid export membrane protein